jgi:hypothetical protein
MTDNRQTTPQVVPMLPFVASSIRLTEILKELGVFMV